MFIQAPQFDLCIDMTLLGGQLEITTGFCQILLNALPFAVNDAQVVLRNGFTLGCSFSASFVFRRNRSHDFLLLLQKLFHFAHGQFLE